MCVKEGTTNPHYIWEGKMKNEKVKNPERVATLGPSLLILLACVIILSVCIIGMGQDVQIPLALCTGLLILYGGLYLHISWKDMASSIVESVASGIEVFLIIFLIGGTVGTWIASGTVPIIIDYGLHIFSPKFFLVSILIICCIMSVVTGSSWTTMGTVGIAFMGVGEGLGINPAITAGCIACGAFFGDKQSPMSDSTNYAAAVAETDLYKHVRSMLYTTGPAIIVSGIIFTVMGLNSAGNSDASVINEIITGLNDAYNMTPLLLLPLVFMVVMIILKVPAIPTMMICALLGVVFSIIFQGNTVAGAFTNMMSGYVGQTGNATIDQLLTRGGMSSMYGTIGIMCWSLSMAGMMMRDGIISSIMVKLESLTRNRTSLIVTHLISGYCLSFIAADPYLAMIIPAKAFGPKYDALGIDRCVTSRTCEDGGTLVCPMVPWGTSGVYTAATLGVATTAYLPYYLMGYINPIFVIICAVTGFGIIKAEKKPEAETAAK